MKTDKDIHEEAEKIAQFDKSIRVSALAAIRNKDVEIKVTLANKTEFKAATKLLTKIFGGAGLLDSVATEGKPIFELTNGNSVRLLGL